MHTVNNDGSEVEQDTGYLVRMLLVFLSFQEGREKRARIRQRRRLNGCWPYRPGVVATSCSNMRPEEVLSMES